jgi:hypothetical protein
VQQDNAFVGKQFPERVEEAGILRSAHMLEHADGYNPIELACELTIIAQIESDPLVEPEALGAPLGNDQLFGTTSPHAARPPLGRVQR